MDAILAGDLTSLGLIEPLAVRRLLDGRAELDAPRRAEHRRAPRVDVVAERAFLHPLPFPFDDEPGVADQLAGEIGADGGRLSIGYLGAEVLEYGTLRAQNAV